MAAQKTIPSAVDLRVQVRRKWSEDWVDIPQMLCDVATVAALPAVGGASLRWDYGRIIDYGETTPKTEGPLPSYYLDFFARIVGPVDTDAEQSEGAPTTVFATGMISVDQDMVGDIDDTPTGTGRNLIVMRGIGYALKLRFMRSSIVENGAGVATIARCLTFNGREGRGAKARPNRSAAKRTVNSRSCYVFSESDNTAEEWTAADICEYLVVAFGGESPQWSIVDADERLSKWSPTIQCGATVLDTLSRVLDRRRGLCGLCTVGDDGNGEIVVDGVFEEDISAGIAVIPGNSDVRNLISDGNDDNVSLVIRKSVDTRYDSVEAVGRRLWLCGTIGSTASATSPGALIEDWTDADEVLYAATPEDERRNRTDLRHVYQRFIHSGDMDYGVCGDDGVIDWGTQPAAYQVGRTIDRQIPIPDAPGVAASKSSLPSDRLRPLMPFITDSAKVYDLTALGDTVKFGKPGNSSVVPLDDRVGLWLRAPYGHLLGGGGGVDAESRPPIAFASAFSITCAWRSNERLRVRRDTRSFNNIAGDVEQRVCYIDVPTAECWAILPGTTTGIGADNAPILQEDVLEVRNDQALLSSVCAIAASWYSRQRAAVQFSREGLKLDILPGVMVSTIRAASRQVTVGSVVSSVVWNVLQKTTTIVTDFGEMDAVAIASSFSSGGAGDFAATPLADQVAPPIMAADATSMQPPLPFVDTASLGDVLTGATREGFNGWLPGPLTVEAQ